MTEWALWHCDRHIVYADWMILYPYFIRSTDKPVECSTIHNAYDIQYGRNAVYFRIVDDVNWCGLFSTDFFFQFLRRTSRRHGHSLPSHTNSTYILNSLMMNTLNSDRTNDKKRWKTNGNMCQTNGNWRMATIAGWYEFLKWHLTHRILLWLWLLQREWKRGEKPNVRHSCGHVFGWVATILINLDVRWMLTVDIVRTQLFMVKLIQRQSRNKINGSVFD